MFNHDFFKIIQKCWIMLMLLSLFSGCTNSFVNYDSLPTMTEDDPFILQEDYTGFISHGTDPTGRREFIYSGENLRIPYRIEAEGIAAKVGFLIFLDGTPQPYLFEDSEGPNSAYQYMHILDLSNTPEKSFTFLIEPTIGKNEDILSLEIISVTSTSLDDQTALLLGSSQSFLPFYASVQFNCDVTPPQKELPQNKHNLLSVKASTEELTLKSIESYTGNWMIQEPVGDLNTNLYSKLFLNGNDVFLDAICDTTQNPLKIKHVILGHPGVRYSIVLFMDYEPLWFEDENCFFHSLEGGNANLLEAELDISELTGHHLLWVLFIPRNANDYPNDSIETNSFSILLDFKERE